MFLLPFFCSVVSVGAVSSLAGVNIAGFDFGAEITGTANLKNAQGPLKTLSGIDGLGQMQHFVNDDGLNTFRLPVSWQFLINSTEAPSSSNSTNRASVQGNSTTPMNGTLGWNSTRTNAAASGTLDASSFGQYDQLVQACLGTGAKCIIDVHNYARFNNKIIGQGGPSNEDFANLWSQIATKYATQQNVIFGIMNEPHDIPDLKIWAATVQAAVTAIRKAGATTQMILLPGNDFTGAQTFVSNGSAGNLSTVHNLDGSNTSLIFDVHKYLDSDGSGTHLECTSDHVTDTFMPLAKFLKANGRQAILSETGGGNTTSCLTSFCATMKFINDNSDVYLGYTGWAAGGFSPLSYNLTMTPKGSNGSFVDQDIVTQCLVGMRTGGTNNTKTVSGTSDTPAANVTQSVFRGTGNGRLEGSSLGLLSLLVTGFWLLCSF